MGLLDGLFQSGGSGGLLDFLRSNAMAQQPSMGLASDQAQYGGGSPFFTQPAMQAMAQQPAPQQPMPQSAQPQLAQPMQQSMPQELQPGGLGAGLSGFINNLHTGPIGALVGGLGSAAGLTDGKTAIARQQANNTATYLRKVGVPEEAISAAVGNGRTPGNPEILKTLLATTGGGQTDDIKEYHFAKKEDPSLTFAKFMSQKKAVSGEFGMQPIWGMKDGKPSIIQLGKSGEAKESVLPPGFSPARDPVKVEGPTGTTILDPQTRQVIQFIPKDVAGAAKSKEIGEAEGQALVNLPTTIATAETALKTIKQLEEHPGKKSWGAFGVGAMLPDIPGTDTRGFAALVDQVKGQNFMTAFQSLKGAGAITEQEGAKAERAQARLDRAQSEKDFNVAINDLKEVITAGMERARQKAGVKNNQPSPTPSATPSVNDLLKKYGG